MIKRLYKFIFFNILGWKVKGSFDKNIKQGLIVVGPHTSNSDFFIGVMTRRILDLNAHFVAKDSLFVWPFGGYFKWMGGYPVIRSRNTKLTDTIADIFKKEDDLLIAITPEGTRSKVEDIKSGFWHIAKKADIHYFLCGFDYGNKELVVSEPYKATSWEDDRLNAIRFFGELTGKNPEKDMRHLLKREKEKQSE
ncbi:1-acyl-sn-glycerol-3-phosphate acyltransferase [Mangrovivirga sp. M17]|uniref:1-acyl-sn-glycerol-3-phosphate acyltransferase n=1 Tax=Mangrovivirga halotolerans TaxID=2993936 RepID=A0ABT3RQS4_9BACT|nr:1-acyl-sn-glycerol-3-phosphate acyltransferase [Mangrovivirga halotolerans]MCX2743970.1 1-acyl-sn-glycerol-3-phosphate acyltransferase [Mangrovivirga halotolerans]